MLRTVELFAGIGGFRLAADAAGLSTVWANDKDAKACAVYRDRFAKDSIREADITDVAGEIPMHDVLTGGFPCQPFSSAGKKNGVRDSRGTLFQAIVDIVRTHTPQYFILENVKRLLSMEVGSHFATILDAFSALEYTIEWRLLNATSFGLPQNRQRIVIVGVRDPNGQDLTNARLATALDIQQLQPRQLERLAHPPSWRPITKHGARFGWWGRAQHGKFFSADLESFSEAVPCPRLHKVLDKYVSDEFDFTEVTLEWIDKNEKVERFIDGVEILSNQDGGRRMGYTIFGINGIAPTLTATASRHYERYKVGDRYRRLTNVEYARLQGFPEDHCRVASVYDQYALYGNAVPPPMIEWVMRRLTETPAVIHEDLTPQMQMFG